MGAASERNISKSDKIIINRVEELANKKGVKEEVAYDLDSEEPYVPKPVRGHY
ncbi:hypothetical protein OG21DRAFT_1502182 [Imleria badia]|nr:hypothetical protein OG21DRAFT_1502182 [Imleria badia]